MQENDLPDHVLVALRRIIRAPEAFLGLPGWYGGGFIHSRVLEALRNYLLPVNSCLSKLFSFTYFSCRSVYKRISLSTLSPMFVSFYWYVLLDLLISCTLEKYCKINNQSDLFYMYTLCAV